MDADVREVLMPAIGVALAAVAWLCGRMQLELGAQQSWGATMREKVIYWAAIVISLAVLAFMAIRTNADELANVTDRQLLLHQEAQRHRLAHGREQQKLDAELCAVAQRWAEHMARTGSRSHGRGEQIIAWGQRSAPAAIRTWIGSSGHNAWLLSRATRAGWGAACSSGGTWCWAGAFRGHSDASISQKTTATKPQGRAREGLIRRLLRRGNTKRGASGKP